jgi:bifunctional NMN adenylyltransferase/nudix hydrolase
MTSPIQNHMLVEPVLQQEVARRIDERHFAFTQPSRSAEPLGTLEIGEGKSVGVYLRHAVDAVLLDDLGQVVLITRRHNPGAGLEALPGGFIDPSQAGVMEQAADAALREAVEETGIGKDVLQAAVVTAVGTRVYSRPFDIREAWGDIEGTPVRKGDLFAVSTQAFQVRLKGDLREIALKASDDATRVRVERVDALRAEQFAVPDHLPMILRAVAQ